MSQVDNSNPIPMIIVAAVVIAGALWFFKGSLFPADQAVDGQPVSQEVPAIQEETPLAGPIKRPVHQMPAEETKDDQVIEEPLPPLDESDDAIFKALTDTFGPSLAPVLAENHLIDKIVATVDNLFGAHLADTVRPVGQLPDQFKVTPGDDDEHFILDPENYRRYDAMVNLATGADPARVASLYRRFYPLFQESYSRLGYPDSYFNDRVVELIDHLLATPDVKDPIVLLRPHVLYTFADPKLEALSSGQKLLIRMGGFHTVTIKAYLRKLRGQITAARAD
jgi:hypothetical protein